LIRRPQHRSLESPWRALLRSFATLAAGESAARLLGFAAVVVMARRLGPTGFGVAVVGTTLVNWFRIIVDSGTEILGVRDTSRTPHRFRELIEPILGLRLALSLAAAAVFAVAALVVPGTSADREALLLFALVLPMMGLNLRFMVLGVNAARAVAIGNVAGQALVAAGAILLLRDAHDVPLVPLLVAASELLYAAVVLAAVARRPGMIRPRVDLRAWRDTLIAGLPLTVNALAAAANHALDLLVIAALLTRREVGLYGAAYKPVLFFSTLLALLSMSFLSTYSGSERSKDRADLTRRTALTGALVAVPAAVALSVGSVLAMSLLYGPDYAGSAAPLAILAWTLPLLTLALPYGTILIWGDRQAVLMRHNIAGVLTNVTATAAAIPLFGLVGAACASVASLALVLALNYRSAIGLGLAEPLWGRPARAASVPPPLSSRPETGQASYGPAPRRPELP
jgi:stage V sporulation protein B